MKRLMLKTVFSGFVTAWRLATWPTSRSPVLVIATTDGVVRAPSAFGITTGSPPSITATQLFVVPRSIPITFGTVASYLFVSCMYCGLFIETVHFSQQVIHNLRHVAYNSDGASILHACRTDHSQQATDLAFLTIACDHQAHIAHVIPFILPANDHLHTIGSTQL